MYDMTIRLHTAGTVCLYEQIYQHIKKEIQEGKLLAGEKLPSTRFLADYLQVARSTIDAAYGQLMDEGYIEAKPCKGYFVSNIDNVLHMENQWEENGQREKQNEKALSDGLDFDFSPYEIDLSGFPFSVWKKIHKNILTDANSELFAKGENKGDYPLRETICRYLHSSRGVNCSAQQIVVGAGNDYLLLLLGQLLGKDLQVAMENPTYLRPYRIFQSLGYRITTVDLDDFGIAVECLEEKKVQAVYVMPSHQFPSGTVMPIGRRMELLNWASREDCYIIEDDYDSEFRYHGKPIPALMASDQNDRVIYIGSFSKSIAPAIRVSFMVLPLPLTKLFHEKCSFYSCTVSRIDQRILNEFIRDGYFERHLNKMRKIYKTKHDFLLEQLKPFRKSFVISGENAGLHILLKSKTLTEKELVERALGEGIKVYGLSSFMTTPDQESGTVLLGFGNLSLEQIEEAVAKLRNVWL